MPEIPRLPRDTYGNPIQVLGVREGGAHVLRVTADSSRNGVDFHPATEIVTLQATQDCLVKFGDHTVTVPGLAVPSDSNDVLFIKAGVVYDLKIVPKGAKRIAALRINAEGHLHVWERA